MNTDNRANKKHLGKRIKMAREMAGLSQGQLAKLMGLHRPSVTEMEAGNRRVTTDELEQIAQHCDVSTTWLLGEREEGTAESAKLQLAARELEKLKPDDLDRLLRLLTTMRQEKQG